MCFVRFLNNTFDDWCLSITSGLDFPDVFVSQCFLGCDGSCYTQLKPHHKHTMNCMGDHLYHPKLKSHHRIRFSHFPRTPPIITHYHLFSTICFGRAVLADRSHGTPIHPQPPKYVLLAMVLRLECPIVSREKC